MIPYVIDTFRGGISDEDDKGVKGSFKFGYGLDIHKKKDTLSCQQAMKNESGSVVVDLINFFVPATDGNAYGFGDAGNIYKRTPAGDWSVKYTDGSSLSIKGAYEWEDDAGNNYLYWATDTQLNRKPLPGASDWSDVVIGWQTLTSADWHTMKQACGNLMICNGNFLAMVDYQGVFTAEAMNLRPGNLATCLEEDNDYAIIGSKRKDEAEIGHVWSWITTALNWVQKKIIPSKGVNALITTEAMFLQAGTDGELYFSDMVNNVPLLAFPGGGQVNPGGVTNKNGMAMFGVFGGDNPGIYSYGRKRKNRPLALNLDYKLTLETVTEIGAIEMVGGDLLVSYQSGTTYSVEVVDPNNKADAIYESLDFDGGSPYFAKLFENIKIKLEPLPTGCSIKAKYRMNKDGNFVAAKFVNSTGVQIETFDTAGGTEVVFNVGDRGEIYEVRVELYHYGNTTPDVLSINTYIADEGEIY
jgi:hypothetical protein